MPTLSAHFRCPHCKAFNIRRIKNPHLLAVNNCAKCGKEIDLTKIKVKYTAQNLRR